MKKLFLIVAMSISVSAFAETPTFSNLNATQVKGIMNDFATATFPANVTGATSYGTIFGFEAGLIGGVSDSPTIASLSSGKKIDSLPKAALLLAATAPFGLGAELSLLPVKVGDFEYDYYSLGLRWTFTDLFDVLPVDIKLRAQFTNSKITYKQTDSSGSFNVSYEGKTTAYSLTVGKRILIVEPYAGFGLIDGDHDLKATGSTTFFDTNVSQSQRENINIDDTYFFAGANVHLLVFTLGAEWTKVYDNSIIMGKLAFGF